MNSLFITLGFGDNKRGWFNFEVSLGVLVFFVCFYLAILIAKAEQHWHYVTKK